MIHITIIGPEVDSKKNNEDGKGGDNGIWQKDHCASAGLTGIDGTPDGMTHSISASWSNLDLKSVGFDSDQWSKAREIIVWGDQIDDAIYCLSCGAGGRLIDFHGIGNNDWLRTITFYVPVYKIDNNLFSGWNRNKELQIIMVGGVLNFGNNAFKDCSNKLTINIIDAPSNGSLLNIQIGSRPDYYHEMPPEWVEWLKIVGIVLAAVLIIAGLIVAGVYSGGAAWAAVPAAVSAGGAAITAAAAGFATFVAICKVVAIVAIKILLALAVSVLFVAAIAVTVVQYVANVLSIQQGITLSYYAHQVDPDFDGRYYGITKTIQVANRHQWWRDGKTISIGDNCFQGCTNDNIADMLFGGGQLVIPPSETELDELAVNMTLTQFIDPYGPNYDGKNSAQSIWYAMVSSRVEGVEYRNEQLSDFFSEEQQALQYALFNFDYRKQCFRGMIEQVGNIGSYAFYKADHILPKKLKLNANVGNYAFTETSRLTSVVYTPGYKNLEIGEGAFSNSSSLHWIQFNGAVGKIGFKAFEDTDLYDAKALETWYRGQGFTDDKDIELLLSKGIEFFINTKAVVEKYPKYFKKLFAKTNGKELFMQYGNNFQDYIYGYALQEYEKIGFSTEQSLTLLKRGFIDYRKRLFLKRTLADPEKITSDGSEKNTATKEEYLKAWLTWPNAALAADEQAYMRADLQYVIKNYALFKVYALIKENPGAFIFNGISTEEDLDWFVDLQVINPMIENLGESFYWDLALIKFLIQGYLLENNNQPTDELAETVQNCIDLWDNSVENSFFSAQWTTLLQAWDKVLACTDYIPELNNSAYGPDIATLGLKEDEYGAFYEKLAHSDRVYVMFCHAVLQEFFQKQQRDEILNIILPEPFSAKYINTVAQDFDVLDNYGLMNYDPIEVNAAFDLNGVKHICNQAFSYQKSLSNINLGSSLQKIEKLAFSNCTLLSSPLIFPTCFSLLGHHAFYKCAKIPEVVFQSQVFGWETASDTYEILIDDRVTSIELEKPDNENKLRTLEADKAKEIENTKATWESQEYKTKYSPSTRKKELEKALAEIDAKYDPQIKEYEKRIKQAETAYANRDDVYKELEDAVAKSADPVYIISWHEKPPFEGCSDIASFTIHPKNLVPIYGTWKKTQGKFTNNSHLGCYIYATAEHDENDDIQYKSSSTLANLTIQTVDGDGQLISEKNDIYPIDAEQENMIRIPGTIQNLYINTAFRLGNETFAYTLPSNVPGVQNVYFNNWDTWEKEWLLTDIYGEQRKFKYKTQVPFCGLPESANRGMYYINNEPLTVYGSAYGSRINDGRSYAVNEKLSPKKYSFYEPAMFYNGYQPYTLVFSRDSDSSPELALSSLSDIDSNNNITLEWDNINLIINHTTQGPNKTLIPFIVQPEEASHKELNNYFTTSLKNIYILSLPVFNQWTRTNNQALALYTGLIDNLAYTDSSGHVVKVYLPSNVGYIGPAAFGDKINVDIGELFNGDVNIPDDISSDNIEKPSSVRYPDLYATHTNSLITHRFSQLLCWDDVDLYTEQDVKTSRASKYISQATDTNGNVFYYFNNKKHNIVLKLKVTKNTLDIVSDPYLPKPQVLAKESFIYALGENNKDIINLTFDYIGASVEAQQTETEYACLKYLFTSENLAKFNQTHLFNFEYIQHNPLKTFKSKKYRPLDALKNFNRFKLISPTTEANETTSIVGPQFAENVTIDTLICDLNKMPINFFAYDTCPKIRFIDCTKVASGELSTKGFANIKNIEIFYSPKILKKINSGCWHKDVLITNYYYMAPLYYWGLEVEMPSIYENPMRGIVNFYDFSVAKIGDGDVLGWRNNNTDRRVIWSNTWGADNEPPTYEAILTQMIKNNEHLSFGEYNNPTPADTTKNTVSLLQNAYYNNWFINSICVDNVAAVGENAFGKQNAIREIYAWDVSMIYNLYTQGLSKSFFSPYINTKTQTKSKTVNEKVFDNATD